MTRRLNPGPMGGDLSIDAPPVPPWSRHAGTYIAAQAWIAEVDKLASAFEAKWGCGRLRLLVDPVLRERFDRERFLYNRSVWRSDLAGLRTEAQRMINAWRAADAAATAAGATRLDPHCLLEFSLKDGTVVVVVENEDQARLVPKDGRRISVWTLDELANVVAAHRIAPRPVLDGERVDPIRRTIGDPLDNVDAREELIIGEDFIPF